MAGLAGYDLLIWVFSTDRPLTSLKLFLSESKSSLLFQSLIESPGNVTNDDNLPVTLSYLSHLMAISGTISGFSVCI